MMRAAIATAAVGLVAASAHTHAQWVSFTDETDPRIVVDSVGMLDAEEKDLDVADFDRDGWHDVVVVRKAPFSTPGAKSDLLLMNERGVLVERTSEYAPEFLAPGGETDARDVVCTDLDGDTWLDIVICTTFEDPLRVYMNRGEDANGDWLGFADESFRLPAITSTFIQRFCAVAASDATGNGSPDLYLANYDGGDNVLLINDGTGNFTDETDARLGSFANVGFATGCEFHDMDNDGDMDIFDVQAGVTRTLWNDGTGIYFKQQVHDFSQEYMATVGDFNNDSMKDIYTVTDDQDAYKLATFIKQDGQNSYDTFTPDPSPRTAGFGGNVHVADIDDDGNLDIGVGPIDTDAGNCPADGVNGDRDVALLRNDGTGQLADPWPITDDLNFHVAAHDFAFFDIDKDGDKDIFMGLCTGWRVLMQSTGECPADFNGDGDLNILDFVAFQTAFQNQDLAADCNGDGQLNILDFTCYQAAFQTGCP